MEKEKKTAWWFWPFVFVMAIVIVGLLLFVIPTKKHAPLVVVCHTTKLSGINAWWANLYNDDMILFTALTVIFISVFGTLLGVLSDVIMAKSGLDIKSRELKEH